MFSWRNMKNVYLIAEKYLPDTPSYLLLLVIKKLPLVSSYAGFNLPTTYYSFTGDGKIKKILSTITGQGIL